jgi:signal transduction histidine kinase
MGGRKDDRGTRRRPATRGLAAVLAATCAAVACLSLTAGSGLVVALLARRPAVAAGAATVAVLAVVICLLIARRAAQIVVQPVAQLRQTVARMADGDLAARAVASGPRELGELASRMNDLAEQTQSLTRTQTFRLLDERTLSYLRHRIHESFDVESLFPDALAAVGPMLSADRLHVWLESEDGQLREAASWHAPGVDPWTPAPTSTAGQWIRVIRNVVARERSPIVVNDTNGVIAREEPTADAFGSLGVRAVILCPLARVAKGVRGVLSVQDAKGPRNWSAYELTLVDAIANEIGTAVGHAKAYALERESVERLEAVDAEKNAFVSTVSHELRTPLTSIIGYLEMLRDGDGGPINRDQGVMLEVIERNSQRLLGLVNDLLMVSRLQVGGHGFEATVVAVAPLVAQAVDALGPSARLQRVAIVSNTGDDVGSVLGDPVQFERVTLNLVSNAVKFTPAGGRVDVDLHRDGDVVRLVVSDNGIGIPADEHHRLFTQFFRSSNARASAVQGTGLGLSIVKSIVDAHGGTVSVASRPERGTTVTVELPADRTESQPRELAAAKRRT